MRKIKINKQSQNRQNIYSAQQYNVSITTDILTTQPGSTINLMAKVEPSGTYEVNFKDGDTVLNVVPISTESDGTISYSWNTTGQSLGIHNITVELINLQYTTSSPLTIALVSGQYQCTGILINNPSPINVYIGDIIPLSATVTVTEQSVVEIRDIDSNLIGSCIVTSTENSCVINIDTTDAPPGEYSIKANIGTFCESDPVDIILNEKPGKLVVLTIPPGAEIYIDDIYKGKSSTIIDITPNIEHLINLTLSGYEEYAPEYPITVEPGGIVFVQTLLVPLSPPPGTGILNVTSTPDNIYFEINSGFDGETPNTIYNVPAGINAYMAGIESPFAIGFVTGSFEIKPDEITNLHINVPIVGAVGIESIPIGADIYIDGIDIGTRTSYTAFIPSGHHTYELRLSGYENKSGVFTVAIDAPVIISETLQPVSGLGAAALLIGGTAVGMMLLSKK